MSKGSRPPISALRRELIRTLTTKPIEEVLSYAFLMKYGREFSPRTRGHGSGIVLLDNRIHHVRWEEESPDCEAIGVQLMKPVRSPLFGKMFWTACVDPWHSILKLIQ